MAFRKQGRTMKELQRKEGQGEIKDHAARVSYNIAPTPRHLIRQGARENSNKSTASTMIV